MGGFWGVGIYHPKHEVNVGTLFRSAQSFGAAFLYTIGSRYRRQSSDTVNARSTLPCFEFTDLDSAVRHLPYSCMLVGVELDPDAESLTDFIHPERALYLLGAEDHGLPALARVRCHKLVQVPGKSCLNVSVAGSVVMYDRIAKQSVGDGRLC